MTRDREGVVVSGAAYSIVSHRRLSNDQLSKPQPKTTYAHD